MARLELELAEPITGTRIAALEHVDDLRVRKVRNGSLSISGTLNVDKEPFAAAAWDEGQSRLLAYLDGVLIGHTLVAPCEDTISRGTNEIRFTSFDPFKMVLARRVVQTATTYTSQDLGVIVKARIDAQNTRKTTFIGTSVYDFTTGSTRTMAVDVDKPEAQIIGDLCRSLTGIDFEIVPTEGATMGQACVWLASTRGDARRVFFEIGPGSKNNIETATISLDPMRVTSNQKTTGRDNAVYAPGNNTTVSDAYGTILDSVDSLSDVASAALIQAYGQQLAAWRTAPRRVVNITPAETSVYLPGRDFDVADYLRVHIDAGRWRGTRAISGYLRCHSWELTRDVSGKAKLASIGVLPEDQGGG